MKIKLMELFSGIGGFALGLQEAGFKIIKHQFSEIDKHAIANYKYNFKHAEHIGSVTDVQGTRGQADIITFGSPCQDFSLVGKRAGMDGQRSSLIMEAIRLVSEIKPSVFIWENVKGTFSSNDGADFWAILNAFTNIGGYRLEWQLLNTSWFLPQNRERIYLIGHLAGRSGPGVFPITENDRVFNKTKNTGKRRPQTQYSTTLKSSGTMKADDTFISTTLNASSSKMTATDTYINVIPVQICKPSRTEEAKKIRKQSMKNGRDFTPFQGKKIEFVDSDIMNSITCATQKDNLILAHYGHKNKKPKASNISPTLKAQSYGHEPMTIEKQQIRRLTEIECERLQGFPDDWTKFGDYDGETKEISKTQRYKMCGNAVTVAVVKAIGERLQSTIKPKP